MRLVEFPQEDGTHILVEVDGASASDIGGPVLAGMVPGLEKAKTTLEAALGKAKAIGTALIRSIRESSLPPDKIVVTFGLRLDASAGIILTSSSGSTNLSVTATWGKDHLLVDRAQRPVPPITDQPRGSPPPLPKT